MGRRGEGSEGGTGDSEGGKSEELRGKGKEQPPSGAGWAGRGERERGRGPVGQKRPFKICPDSGHLTRFGGIRIIGVLIWTRLKCFPCWTVIRRA